MEIVNASSSTALQPVRFGEFLVERNVISEGALLDSLADHWVQGCRLGESVARRGYLPSDEVERLAAEFQNLHVVYV
jgi:hypothetical protein